MKKDTCLMLAVAVAAGNLWAAEPALTIYNQQFAVVRDKVHLDLKSGINVVNYSEATRQVEPDSVILRDPTSQHPLQILEQNYRADTVSQGLLLSLFEGKTIRFETEETVGGQIQKKLIQGKIIRSGYTRRTEPWSRLSSDNLMRGAAANPVPASEPVIEVDGELIFRLPGVPRFPSLPDDSILKPTLSWRINNAAAASSFNAELGYVTGGFSWKADYNFVAPEKGDTLDLVGWVSIANESGKSFPDARIKLMAGDVNKVQPVRTAAGGRGGGGMASGGAMAAPPPVTEETFDEYHLYTLEHPTTLLDREIKQVEFVQASQVPCKPIYIYDGARADALRYGAALLRTSPDYGVTGNTKVSVMREFYNSTSNHLGMPLPKGRMRFYRLDSDGQMQFVGENDIDHTAKDEVIRVTVGNAFDVVGERVRTDYHIESSRAISDESFQIKVRNHKADPVTVRVVEHLRGVNWDISVKSDEYIKKDAQTLEFRVNVPPDGQKIITYKVNYSW